MKFHLLIATLVAAGHLVQGEILVNPGTKSAAAESARAVFEQGRSCFNAQGVPQDTTKARGLWKQAVALGNGRAAANAAMVYLAGDGVAPDQKQALKLATRAAEVNDPSALEALLAFLPLQ
ncbi:MAG: hypothetical protein K9N23_07965 [Akkermansiaceae bacterium]|nr:hypothetical protein [Akkermansiaceae bacterium]